MMSDFEDDTDMPWDKEQTIVIASKLKIMFDNIKIAIDTDLMRFTIDELEILETVYGSQLVFPIYPEIEKLLAGPEQSTLIH